MLLLTVKMKKSYFCHVIDDCRLIVDKDGHRRLLRQPLPQLPPKSDSLDRKPLKRTLKIVIRMLKHSSPQLVASDVSTGGEGLTFL